MSIRNAIVAGTFVAALAAPAATLAATAFTTGAVNMRTGPGVSHHRILTIPGGARVDVHGCASWCSVSYRGYNGYVAATYVSRGYMPVPRHHYRRPPPPLWGWRRRPRWDERHHAWYDGYRWYFDGRWHDRPNGLSFGFRFGG